MGFIVAVECLMGHRLAPTRLRRSRASGGRSPGTERSAGTPDAEIETLRFSNETKKNHLGNPHLGKNDSTNLYKKRNFGLYLNCHYESLL